HVLVVSDLVGAHLAEVLAGEDALLGGVARAGGARGGDGDDVRRFGDARFEEGPQREDDGDGVAAGGGDAVGGGDGLAVAGQLGQAVGPGPGGGAVVVGLPGGGVFEAVVGAEVDDLGVGGQPGGQRTGLAVREGHDEEVGD